MEKWEVTPAPERVLTLSRGPGQALQMRVLSYSYCCRVDAPENGRDKVETRACAVTLKEGIHANP